MNVIGRTTITPAEAMAVTQSRPLPARGIAAYPSLRD
jgi:hypothetical protein